MIKQQAYMNKSIGFILVFLVSLLGIVFLIKHQTNTQSKAAPAGFVTRNGKALVLNGAPYKFVGFNVYGMTGCETGSPWNQGQIDAYFQSLPPASMTRIWAFQTRSSNLDLIVARAEANNQKLVMSLGNGLRNCEDVGDDGGGRGAAWFQSGYKGAYMTWVNTAVSKYKNSPAVGMWEVSNEGGHQSNVAANVMKAYYDDVAAKIKSIDPEHLVTTGALAEYTYGGQANFQLIHSGPNIDVVSFHEYDGNGVSDHFGATKAAADALNKPIFIGETGVSSCDPQRATYLKGKFDGYLNGGAVGVLPWNRSLSDGCGFSRIGPASATSTMVKSYNIAGVQPNPIGGNSLPSPTPNTATTAPTTTAPTTTITVAPTAATGNSAIAFTVYLNGIGTAGDSTNPQGTGNTTPHYQQRTLTVDLLNAQNVTLNTFSLRVTYQPALGAFTGSTLITVPSGTYFVRGKSDRYLAKILTTPITITVGQTTSVPPIHLVAGDINGDNAINVLDYNVLIGCYSDLSAAILCTDNDKILADLTDDVAVNQFDYNLFIRELKGQTTN